MKEMELRTKKKLKEEKKKRKRREGKKRSRSIEKGKEEGKKRKFIEEGKEVRSSSLYKNWTFLEGKERQEKLEGITDKRITLKRKGKNSKREEDYDERNKENIPPKRKELEEWKGKGRWKRREEEEEEEENRMMMPPPKVVPERKGRKKKERGEEEKRDRKGEGKWTNSDVIRALESIKRRMTKEAREKAVFGHAPRPRSLASEARKAIGSTYSQENRGLRLGKEFVDREFSPFLAEAKRVLDDICLDERGGQSDGRESKRRHGSDDCNGDTSASASGRERGGANDKCPPRYAAWGIQGEIKSIGNGKAELDKGGGGVGSEADVCPSVPALALPSATLSANILTSTGRRGGAFRTTQQRGCQEEEDYMMTERFKEDRGRRPWVEAVTTTASNTTTNPATTTTTRACEGLALFESNNNEVVVGGDSIDGLMSSVGNDVGGGGGVEDAALGEEEREEGAEWWF